MMRWYYANNNQRQGPVGENEFARLVRDGVIRDDTLVWRHGMKDWQPYAEVAPALEPPELPDGIEPGKADMPPGEQLLAKAAAVLAEQPARLEIAGLGVRAAAMMIDFLVVMGLSQMLSLAMGAPKIDIDVLLSGDLGQLLPLMRELALLFFVDGAMRLAYYWYFMYRYEATPGKLVLGLKVVRSDGSRLSHGRIVGRFFGEVVSKSFTFGIGYLMAAFDDQRRALHDQMCDTRVVKK